MEKKTVVKAAMPKNIHHVTPS